MTKLPISVCIIARNEEKYIETCLKHLKPLGMEIVVVDTGSSDSTKQIATKYTSKVYDFKWINDFSAARNFAADKASNSWILSLDCDEYITKFDASKLKLYLQQFPKSIGVMDMVTVRTLDSGEKTYHTDELPRLYNKKYYEYRFRIHEQITPRNADNNEHIVVYSFKMPVTAEHHGYDISSEGIAQKQERNLALLEMSLGEVPGHDDYLYYQIGQSYCVLGKIQEACGAYRKCFDHNSDMKKDFIPDALLSYARVLNRLDMNNEIIRLYNQYKDVLNTAEHFYYLALSYEKAELFDSAFLLYTNLINMPDIDTLGQRVYEIYVKIMQMCNKKGDIVGQNAYLQKLVEYGKAHGKEVSFQ